MAHLCFRKLFEDLEEVNYERGNSNSVPNSEGQSQRMSGPAWKKENEEFESKVL